MDRNGKKRIDTKIILKFTMTTFDETNFGTNILSPDINFDILYLWIRAWT